MLLRAVPVFRIFDVAKAREFYIDYLGFSVDFEHRFQNDAPLFMGITRDNVTIFLSEHHGDGSPGAHVRIDVSEVDVFHDVLQSKKYKFMNPAVQDQEWGAREFTVIDPFGNRLTFSQQTRE